MQFAKTYFQSLKSYSKSFWLMCLNVLLFIMSFNLLLPEMNAYLTDLGGADKKWMILGLWTIAAAIARPFSGKIADSISRKSVMYFGVFVSIIISFLYPFFITVGGFLVLRFLHGFSTGFHPTGATALIADVVPKGKRGEAMGIFGVTVSVGFSLGQAIGSPIKIAFGTDGLFYASGIMGILSLLFLLKAKEEKIKVGPVRIPIYKRIIPRLNEILALEVIQPSIIMFVTAMCSGIYMMIVPDISENLGMQNKGMFYLVNVVFMIITRILSGRFYDLFGARKNLYLGLSLMIVGAIVTGTSTTIFQFLLSSIIFGIAASICSPALFAWTADLALKEFKGRGMATMFIALELGIAFGALCTQIIYNNDHNMVLSLFIFMSIMCVLGIIYLYVTRNVKTNLLN